MSNQNVPEKTPKNKKELVKKIAQGTGTGASILGALAGLVIAILNIGGNSDS